MMNARLLILLVTACFCIPRASTAGAWTQPKGRHYLKLGLNRFSSRSQYFLDGDRQPLSDNGKVTDLSLSAYLEYGLFEELTLVASVPFKQINFSCAVEGCDYSSSGIGDIYAGFRYRVARTSWQVSVQTGLKIPTGYQTDEAELQSAPPLGDGQTDFEFKLLFGRAILNYLGYVNIDVGFRARSAEPVDEVPYALEMGLNLTKEYMLIGKLYGVRSIAENDNQTDFRIIDGKIENFVGTGAVEDFTKVQFQLLYKLSPHRQLSFEFDQVITGRNTSHATTLGVGIVFHN